MEADRVLSYANIGRALVLLRGSSPVSSTRPDRFPHFLSSISSFLFLFFFFLFFLLLPFPTSPITFRAWTHSPSSSVSSIAYRPLCTLSSTTMRKREHQTTLKTVGGKTFAALDRRSYRVASVRFCYDTANLLPRSLYRNCHAAHVVSR